VLFLTYRYDTASEMPLGGSIYPAAQNFLLAARALGLGACLTSWAAYGGEALLREAVGIPEDWLLAAGVGSGCHRPDAPLRPEAFDAVVHTDVLCCLGPKLATLRATFRALRPGARTGFSVIFPTAGLRAAEARRAIDAGPPHCRLRTSYPSMLHSAGFVDIEEHDLTTDYHATATRKLDLAEQFADAMIDMLGRQDFDDMQADRRHAVAAIADGLLRRSLFVARRPGHRRRSPGASQSPQVG
jgi:Nitroreductase family